MSKLWDGLALVEDAEGSGGKEVRQESTIIGEQEKGCVGMCQGPGGSFKLLDSLQWPYQRCLKNKRKEGGVWISTTARDQGNWGGAKKIK